MDMPANPLLLQLKQLFLLYLYGLQGAVSLDSMLAHFKDFPETSVPTLEILLNEKERLYLLTGVKRFEEFLEREDIPATLQKLAQWQVRCKFLSAYEPETLRDSALLASVLEHFFLQEPSLPLVQSLLQDFKDTAMRDIQSLVETNRALEVVRQEQNEQIYDILREVFPEN